LSRFSLRVRLVGIQTGASRTPATGGQSESDPVAASEEEHPLHVGHSTPQAANAETPPSRARKLRNVAWGARTSRVI